MFEGDAVNLDSADYGSATAEFFEIRIPTRSLPIRIEYSAVGSLHSVLSGENGSVGLLLGKLSSEGLSVDYCELLPRESANADAFFRARSEHPPQRVVGFFRSQPEGWPEMREADREIARRCFRHPDSVFLFIQTPGRRPWSAAFFDLAAERLYPSRTPAVEFFFDEYLLRNGYSTALVPIPEQQALPEPAPVRPWTHRIALVTLVAVILIGAGGYWYVNRNRVETASVSASASPLALKVVRNGKDFEVSWDRLAPALQQASAGTLTIKDGGLTRSVPLSALQLREGRILYSALFGDLTFRLEIQQGAHTQAESVQFLSWDPHPPVDLPATLDPIPDVPPVTRAPERPVPAPRPSPAIAKQAPPVLATRPPEAVKPAAAPQIAAQVAPAPPAPSPNLIPNPSVPVAAVQPPEVKVLDHPSEPVAAPPVAAPPPQLERERPAPTNSDPVITPQSLDPAYAPPVALSRTSPRISPEVKVELEGLHGAQLRLSVKVTIDKSGNVRNAVVLSSTAKSGFVDTLIRSAALDAARQWKFRPGTLHGKAIAGDVNIEFNFR